MKEGITGLGNCYREQIGKRAKTAEGIALGATRMNRLP